MTSRAPGTHDLPGLARFRAQALGWRILSGRERAIVTGPTKNPSAGRCLLPVTDHKMVKHHVQLDQASSAADREQEAACLPSGHAGPASGRPALNPGPSLPTQRETSSASCARRRRSSVKAEHRAPQTHLSAA